MKSPLFRPALAALALAACTDPSAPAVADSAAEPNLAVSQSQQTKKVANSYIVVLKEGVDDVDGKAGKLAAKHGGSLKHVYKAALKGFALELSDAKAVKLADDPDVAYVEQDQEVEAFTTQAGATWGLDRIDQQPLPLSGTFSYTNSGSGVRAYIIDTGIRTAHVEFGGRASLGFDAFARAAKGGDCNGHGTHVAGTVGGARYGVAKNVGLVAVRVLDCRGSGTTSGVIAGVNWVVSNHVKPAVANMSLGGGASTTLDNAVANAINAGVTFVVAAGNSNADACGHSPARTPSAITVGATTTADARASYSNFGTCLDLFAPGSGITSAWYTSNTATSTISGTSMASPHVAGVAALYLGTAGHAAPSVVRDAIVNGATVGAVTGPGAGSPNALLFTSY